MAIFPAISYKLMPDIIAEAMSHVTRKTSELTGGCIFHSWQNR